jgi:hypothetical protein
MSGRKLIKHPATKTYVRSGCTRISPPILISVLDGEEWSASRPCRFIPGKMLPVPFE